jgi:hypothetical protein
MPELHSLKVFTTMRLVCGSAIATALAFSGAYGQTPAAGNPATSSGTVRGVVTDSLRGGPLAGAAVELLPARRQVFTDTSGRFQFDSVAGPARYSVRVLHPLLDTLGIALASPEFAIEPRGTEILELAVPSAQSLVGHLCPHDEISSGPSALVGFVRDPVTGQAIDSATVSLVYKRGGTAVNRLAKPDAAGRYRICGLPQTMVGSVQLLQGASQSATMPANITPDNPLALRAIAATVAPDSLARPAPTSADTSSRPRPDLPKPPGIINR